MNIRVFGITDLITVQDHGLVVVVEPVHVESREATPAGRLVAALNMNAGKPQKQLAFIRASSNKIKM